MLDNYSSIIVKSTDDRDFIIALIRQITIIYCQLGGLMLLITNSNTRVQFLNLIISVIV